MEKVLPSLIRVLGLFFSLLKQNTEKLENEKKIFRLDQSDKFKELSSHVRSSFTYLTPWRKQAEHEKWKIHLMYDVS